MLSHRAPYRILNAFKGISVIMKNSAPIGSIVLYAGQIAGDGSSGDPSYTPVTRIEALGWMRCDGRTLAVSKYSALFGMLGYRYGGSGDSFNIPNIPGQAANGVDMNFIIKYM